MKRLGFLIMLACTLYVGNEVRQSESFQTTLDTGSKLIAVFSEEAQPDAEQVAATELTPAEEVQAAPAETPVAQTELTAENTPAPTNDEQVAAAPDAGSGNIPMQSLLLYVAMAGGIAYAGKQAYGLASTALAQPDDLKYNRFARRMKGLIPELFYGDGLNARVQDRMVSVIQNGKRVVSGQTRRAIATAKMKLNAANMKHAAGFVTKVAVENAQKAVELAEAQAVAERIAAAEWYLTQSTDRFAADTSGEMGRRALRRGAYHGAVAEAAKEVIGRLRPVHAAHLAQA